MDNYLLVIHILAGEIGAFSFLWNFIEMLNPTDTRLSRARTSAMIGLVSIVISWISGGIYYLTKYGSSIKPIIKAGPLPWAHLVIMEVKEHVFLFLPFLAFMAYASLKDQNVCPIEKSDCHKSHLRFSGLVFLLGLSMVAMGFMITFGYREAVEGMIAK